MRHSIRQSGSDWYHHSLVILCRKPPSSPGSSQLLVSSQAAVADPSSRLPPPCQDPLLTALIAAFVQTFYAWRIYIVSSRRNKWLPAVVLSLTFFQLLVGVAATGFALRTPTFVEVAKPHMVALVGTWLFLLAAGVSAFILAAVAHGGAQLRGHFPSNG